ncbi:MAG: metalloregulator ArsR/SmtB family transcription factor [bacterium]
MDAPKPQVLGLGVFAFKAIADESRWRMLEMLLNQDLCVGALARRMGLSEGAVSQHLQVLRKAGLVKGEKRGYWTHYSVDREALLQLARKLEAMAQPCQPGERKCYRSLSQGEMQQERRLEAMGCNDCCQRPEKLKARPQQCTPEQVRECHGEVPKHPCEFPVAGDKEEKKNPTEPRRKAGPAKEEC